MPLVRLSQLFIYSTLIFLLFSYSDLIANTIKVCPDCGIASVRQAVAIALPGDTVLVKDATYAEHDILIDKPVTIIGENHPTIDAQGQGYIFKVYADSVTIRGLKLKNVEVSYISDFAAIYTSKVRHFIFENNILEDIFFGFLIEKSHNGILKNNIIRGNAVKEHSSGNGIHLWHSSKIQILDNRIEKMRDGIYLEFVKHSEIKGNISLNNLRYGLHFMFSNDDRYEDNIFEKNGAGVAVMFSKQIFMRHNTFRLNWGTASYGLLLKEINDANIVNNTFEQNTIGINADGSNRITYEKNTFHNNGWAVRFLGACYGNKLLQNNFLNNALDISYVGRMNGNIFDKNFWSDYTGYDLNKDNIGDVPYRPVKLFSYIVNQTPETIILLRSLFVDIINFSEKVSPIFTPDNLQDLNPAMVPIINYD
ncbi:MAG: nitrous oxide reductase family maturation protein NosD [Calditrichaeota bacterium]|nr:MAG: nitrous oxide reductase family maturation protein NosD [Calditrichota bacterium]